MSTKTSKIRRRREGILLKNKYRLILEGMIVGLLVGLLISAFRIALTKAEQVRNILLEGAKHNPMIGIWGLLILVAFSIAVAFIVKNEPLSSGSGIPQVKGELMGKVKSKWFSVIIAKFLGGIMAIGGGLSLGREGPSIQLGAMVGKGLSRLSGKLKKEEHLLITCGAGAGLAAAFSAPLAGVVFTLEELHKEFSAKVLICTMAAAVTGEWVSSYVFGLTPVFNLVILSGLPLSKYWMIVLLGLLLGILGVFYNWLIQFFQNLFDIIKPKWVKVLIPFLSIVVLALIYPRALGGGHGLVALVASRGLGLKALVVLLVVKLIFSTFSFGTKAPGGIFLPLLVLGAVTGGLFAEVISPLVGYSNLDLTYFVVLGMTGLFASIVRAPITGIILITEMTGIFTNLLPFAIVSLTAYITASVLKGRPIYDQLLTRMLEPDKDREGEAQKR